MLVVVLCGENGTIPNLPLLFFSVIVLVREFRYMWVVVVAVIRMVAILLTFTSVM